MVSMEYLTWSNVTANKYLQLYLDTDLDLGIRDQDSSGPFGQQGLGDVMCVLKGQ